LGGCARGFAILSRVAGYAGRISGGPLRIAKGSSTASGTTRSPLGAPKAQGAANPRTLTTVLSGLAGEAICNAIHSSKRVIRVPGAGTARVSFASEPRRDPVGSNRARIADGGILGAPLAIQATNSSTSAAVPLGSSRTWYARGGGGGS